MTACEAATSFSKYNRHSPRRRGIQYAVASRFNHRRLRVLDRPVKPGDDAECGANCLHTVIASTATCPPKL
ncbi:hypothetical protein E4K65_31530 [Bradyrhizobium niftali]|uniref:Uncharacterized protein n=1 Tax=Bradyrhizobium niftali TaxID=2560055 RepID=A0A4Y9LK30_9BRAD|nr:hypothetical protein E4K65_31530 [Bradyrhizobium niftali]